MKNYSGETLIEVVIFIVVIGIMLSSIFVPLNTILYESNRPGEDLVASLLADAEMNLILHQRIISGFANISDPCAATSIPTSSPCSQLKTFAQQHGYLITSTFSSGSGTQTATVTVTGKGNAHVVTEFVQ